jgi:hypothetical protein
MLSWASSEFVAAITYLLPGFLAAWVFLGLTAHPRREPFERVVQAIIFTGVVHALNYGVEWTLGEATAWVTLGAWTHEVATCWLVVNALFVGILFSVFANYGWLHTLLQTVQFTKRTSFPSEWFSAFNRDKRYVVLHLEGDRRIHGWPEEWPDSGESGHFVLCDASWMLDNNEMVPIYADEQLIIPVSTVKMVERLKRIEEMVACVEQVRSAEQRITALYQKESQHGQQSPRPVSKTEHAANGAARPNGETAAATNHSTTPAAPTSAASTQKLTRRQRRRVKRS